MAKAKYQIVSEKLGMDVSEYLRELKAQVRVSDDKLAWDLFQDSGVYVSQPTIWTWRNKK